MVYCRNNNHTEKHKQISFTFLGYTFRPRICHTVNGRIMLFSPCMSTSSKKEVRRKVRGIITQRFKGTIRKLAEILNPKIRGWYQYYCKFSKWSAKELWYWLNQRMIRWIMANKKIGKSCAYRYLKNMYIDRPNLFYHWQIVRP